MPQAQPGFNRKRRSNVVVEFLLAPWHPASIDCAPQRAQGTLDLFIRNRSYNILKSLGQHLVPAIKVLEPATHLLLPSSDRISDGAALPRAAQRLAPQRSIR